MRRLPITCMFALTPAVAGQCTWLQGDGLPGVSGVINASAAWDPDGPGPEPVLLVVGGSFWLAGDQLTVGAAAWDGLRWRAMPLPAPSIANVLTVIDGELIAGATTGVYRRSGNAWESIGAGIGTVSALATFEGQLYAGAVPTTGGNYFLVRWDGANWQAVPGGPDNVVNALLNDGSSLIAGGYYGTAGGAYVGGLARFDGQSWSRIGGAAAPFGNVKALAIFQNALYAGGSLQMTGVTERNLARYDGAAWSIVGGGVSGDVNALLAFGGNLYVGGGFAAAGGTPSTMGFAVWDGAAWHGPGATRTVYALAPYEGSVAIGGAMAGLAPAGGSSIALWDGAVWRALGSGFNDQVTGLAALAGELIAIGSFHHAGAVSTGNAARLSASGWQAMGPEFNSVPKAVAVHGGEVYVGGGFSAVGTTPVSRVARWDGAQWIAIPGGFDNGIVYALADIGGELVAGGTFLTAGTPGTQRIARLQGGAWTPFASGLGGPSFNIETVHSALLLNNQLVVGGNFLLPNSTRGTARWDGMAWQPMGSGLGSTFNDRVYAMALFNGALYAAGTFTIPGQTPNAGIALWDGTDWQPVGNSGHVTVYALAPFEDALYAGGSFTTIGGVPAAGLARWDGQSWSAPPSGPRLVLALQPRERELDVGGYFWQVGGVVSAHFARFSCACYANCDGSAVVPVLNVVDFGCFLNRFASADPYANCDASTAPPVLNIADFSCFLNRFAAGCS